MKNITFIFFLFISVGLFSQNEGKNWVMGFDVGVNRQAVLSFTQDTVIQSSQKNIISMQGTVAVISEPSTGELLFHTNGVQVSSTTGLLSNGSNLSPCDYSIMESDGINGPQAALILPFPNNPKKYYIFHETIVLTGPECYADTLQYSMVDYTQNSNGAVVNKNTHLLQGTFAPGEITACRHANGRDWWILFPYYKANKYYEYLLKPDGLHGPYEIKTNENFGTINGGGYACFSPDGKKYARYDAYIESKLYVYDFDRCTGNFSNGKWIDLLPYKGIYEGGGIAFSPNSHYLYLTIPSKLYQLDVPNLGISPPLLVATFDGFIDTNIGQYVDFAISKLAPNGKIYVSARGSGRYLHTVHSPDSGGLACDFRQHDFLLTNRIFLGLPNMPDFNLGADSTFCDSTLSLHLNNQLVVSSKQVQIYPNPVEKELSISLQNVQEKTTFVLYDALGKVVLQQAILQGVEVAKINMAYLPKGMYFYLLKEEQGIVSQGKIIKE